MDRLRRRIAAETVSSVLLISDDAALGDELGAALQRRIPAAFFRTADSEERAAAMLRSFCPDLLVLDLTGGVDASAIARDVVRSRLYARTHVVALVGSGVTSERDAWALQVASVLRRPVAADALLDAVTGEATVPATAAVAQTVAAPAAAAAVASAPRREPAMIPGGQGGAVVVAGQLGLSVDRYVGLVERFLQLTPPKLEKLLGQVDSPDVEAVRALAHDIKGSAATLRLTVVAGPAGRIEQRARAGELSPADLVEEVERLRQAMAELASWRRAQND